ncbi:MAG: hypothetical protein D3909_03835 [Candidatus Electrothrix sp. ATG1]|nr:hypothetical protein [Candidatus Electrothrix sp. ATG1]MCI5208511.1 hypothetical protein [Candidatus Electrothrix sp. ATG2]
MKFLSVLSCYFIYPTTFFPDCNQPDRSEEKNPDFGSNITRALVNVIVFDKERSIAKKLTSQGKNAILKRRPVFFVR